MGIQFNAVLILFLRYTLYIAEKQVLNTKMYYVHDLEFDLLVNHVAHWTYQYNSRLCLSIDNQKII